MDLLGALEDPVRPKAILFWLASQEDLEWMESMVRKVGRQSMPSTKDQRDQEILVAENDNEGANLVTVVDTLEKGKIRLKFTDHDHLALSSSDFLCGLRLPSHHTLNQHTTPPSQTQMTAI